MSKKVYIKAMSGIEPPIYVNESHHPFNFVQPMQSKGQAILLKISATGDNISAESAFEVSDELYKNLPKFSKIEDYDNDLRVELKIIYGKLHKANARLLNIILQELKIRKSHILTSGGKHWSLDENNWNPAPHLGIKIGNVEITPTFHLDNKTKKQIQNFLNRKEEPLLAIQYLHEAQRNKDERYSWILATVSAELAIKEILMKIEPKLRTLLMELPSPPINKLYGIILESVIGQRSKYVNKLNEGASKRNKLLHRPVGVDFKDSESINYNNVVEKAIYELIDIIRSTDLIEKEQ